MKNVLALCLILGAKCDHLVADWSPALTITGSERDVDVEFVTDLLLWEILLMSILLTSASLVTHLFACLCFLVVSGELSLG